jgi:oxaloacetate decarboxylase gamma subunit
MELLNNGLLLLVIGMGTVFAFLSIMVLAIEISSRVCSRFAHLIPEKAPAKPKRPRPQTSADDDGDLLAVIAAAVTRYRQDNQSRK